MNIYLISQDKNGGYDTYDSAVVVAENEEQARKISPSSFHEWSDEHDSWVFLYSSGRKVAEECYSWTLPENVTVEKIGTADVTEQKVICSSFNAG